MRRHLLQGLLYSVSIFFSSIIMFACTKPDDGPGADQDQLAVKSVTLDRTGVELTETDVIQLVATLQPENAANRKLRWSSSNSRVAHVDSLGKVTAVNAGTAVITVTTEDGGKMATCNVEVAAEQCVVTGLTMEEAESAREKVIADWKAANLKDMMAGFEKLSLTNADNVTMKYLANRWGSMPADGYSLWISLHGGGGVAAKDNDGQWQNQQIMYRYAATPKPDEGIYVSPRSIENVWDMWFLKENDWFFEQIIKTMVVCWGVNPDKVYLMGYSAGGDGVWRMAPRMADHWAAAAMMAGHPGSVNLMNVRNMPFTLWVGGEDAAYDRNTLVPQKAGDLEYFHAKDPGGYIYNCHVLKGKPHWMDLEDASAFDWMARFKRNPYPKRVVWRQENEERKVVRQFFYWIKVGREEMTPGNTVIAEIVGNTINIEKCDYKTLTIYLNDKLVNLDKKVRVYYDGREVFRGMVERRTETLVTTMAEREDPSYVFCSEINVKL